MMSRLEVLSRESYTRDRNESNGDECQGIRFAYLLKMMFS